MVSQEMRINIERGTLNKLCHKYHIVKLSFFGSVLRSDFDAKSDIDILVEFEKGFVPGLDFFLIEEQLSLLFGRKVDLVTPHFLSRYFRDRVLAEAQVQYEAA